MLIVTIHTETFQDLVPIAHYINAENICVGDVTRVICIRFRCTNAQRKFDFNTLLDFEKKVLKKCERR